MVETNQPFMFGEHLTSADAFFLNVLFRMSMASVADLDELLGRTKYCAKYWEAVKATKESHAVTDYGKSFSFRHMISHGVPFKCMGLKMGWMKVPELPDDVETEIREAQKARQQEYYEEESEDYSKEQADKEKPRKKKGKSCCH